MKKSRGSSKVFAVYSAALTAKQMHGDRESDMSNDIKEGLDGHGKTLKVYTI